ncbi:ABC transporter six-transmembrane domain-containing protein, partial [Glaesserella parasuis]
MITSAFSIIGAVVMLLLIEFWSGVVALLIVVGFGLLLPHYVKVNDRLEKEVDCVERAKNSELIKHYRLVE